MILTLGRTDLFSVLPLTVILPLSKCSPCLLYTWEVLNLELKLCWHGTERTGCVNFAVESCVQQRRLGLAGGLTENILKSWADSAGVSVA